MRSATPPVFGCVFCRYAGTRASSDLGLRRRGRRQLPPRGGWPTFTVTWRQTAVLNPLSVASQPSVLLWQLEVKIPSASKKRSPIMKAVDDQPVWSVICFCCAGRVPRPTLTHATDVVADREVSCTSRSASLTPRPRRGRGCRRRCGRCPAAPAGGPRRSGGCVIFARFGASAVLPPHQEPASIRSTGWCCEPSWPGWHWRSSASLFPAPRTSATSGCSRCSTWRSAGGGAGAAARHPGGRPNPRRTIVGLAILVTVSLAVHILYGDPGHPPL